MTPGGGRRESPGSLRPSQVTTTFGPGALVQTEHDTVVVMGADLWSQGDEHYKMINHPYLEEALRKSHFRMPASAEGSRVISCRSFPTWGVCSRASCRRLQRHRGSPPRGGRTFECDECGSSLYAARLIAVCDRGHMAEFPWSGWAHSRSDKQCGGANPRLRFRARGRSPGLSDYYVLCDDCGASRSCAGATASDGLSGIAGGCKGETPWLGGSERCSADGGPAPVRGVQILSTSLYYPSTVTALQIPKWLSPIQKAITASMREIRGAAGMGAPYSKIAEQLPELAEVRDKYGAAEVAEGLERRLAIKSEIGGKPTELQIRDREYEDLMQSEGEGGGDLEISESALGADLRGHVGRLKVIKRITEIRVLRAFTRGDPPDPFPAEEDREVHYCRITRRRTDWYPATENKGEGFLFSLDEERLRRWEGSPAVEARCAATVDAFEQWSESKKWSKHERIRPRYLLLHSLAHALIRELAKGSGYGEAAIRERIYRGAGHNGVLLYTASPASDGSLGGLVRHGEAGRFGALLRAAVGNSASCSRDPLCAEDDPVEKKASGVPVHARLNGSACYGCMLLPETSCETMNQLLDRRLLFDEGTGFFADMARGPGACGAGKML